MKLKLHLIHVEASLHGIFCLGRQGIEDLSESESLELMHAVQAFSADQFQGQFQKQFQKSFEKPSQESSESPLLKSVNPWLWELKLKSKDQLKTYSLKKNINQEISPYMPSGKDSASWRLWMTEVQMLFHSHPVNLARQAAGKKTVDWVWPEKTLFF